MGRAFISLGLSTVSSPHPQTLYSSYSHRRLFHQPPRIASTTSPMTHDEPLSHHPSLEVVGGASNSFLKAFNKLKLPYKPFPFIGWNCHVETIFAAFFRSIPDVRFSRECLRTKDNGAVSLDWVSGEDGRLSPDSPLLILLVCCYVLLLLLCLYLDKN